MELTTIFKYISENSNLFLMLGGVALGLIVLALLALSSFLGKIFNISIGPFKFATGSTKKDCPYSEVCKQIQSAISFYNLEDKSKSLVELVVSETLSLAEEKDRLLFKESVAHRMVIAEDFNLRIKTIITENYHKQLKKLLPENEDVKIHKDYKYFQVLVNTILDELKRNSLKQSIENTNIADFSEPDFQTFCKQKADIMFTMIVDYLDLMYGYNSVVSRESMHQMVMDVSDKVVILFKEMYAAIRQVKIEDDSQIHSMTQHIKTNAEELRIKNISEDPILKINKTLDEHLK